MRHDLNDFWMRRSVRFFRDVWRDGAYRTVFLFIGFYAFMVAMSETFELKLSAKGFLRPDVDLFGVFTSLAFLLTFLELVRKRNVEQADVVTDHFATFLTDTELSGTFYSLIYNFDDLEFEKVEQILNSEGFDTTFEGKVIRIDESERQRHWKALDQINAGRASGSRLFHPKFFQGSEEERRFDIFLNFFDVFAYGYLNGTIKLTDFNGVAAYYLTIIQSRKIFRTYMWLIDQGWPQLGYRQSTALEQGPLSSKPYENLRELLKSIGLPLPKQPQPKTKEIGDVSS